MSRCRNCSNCNCRDEFTASSWATTSAPAAECREEGDGAAKSCQDTTTNIFKNSRALHDKISSLSAAPSVVSTPYTVQSILPPASPVNCKPSNIRPKDFRLQRDKIILKANVHAMNGGSFADTKMYFNTRRLLRRPDKPKALFVNSQVLNLASEEILKYACPSSETDIDFYADDSDLDSDSELQDTEFSSTQEHPMPTEKQRGRLHELSDIAPGSSLSTQHPSVSTFSLESDPTETPKQHHDLFVKLQSLLRAAFLSDERERSTHAPPSPTESTKSPVNGREELVLHEEAFRTWHALYLYLLTDKITFNKLRSAHVLSEKTQDEESWPCSPKSMYRLADKFKLDDLKVLALEAIKDGVCGTNVVVELFSDFTWRYPEVLGR
ncbi:hypothetical protein C8Q75DRAFT_171729 [Abortiporus biennis]|nr:hypothetical protein C8Q75DRAFT_171729 [Abortiporus biennis]